MVTERRERGGALDGVRGRHGNSPPAATTSAAKITLIRALIAIPAHRDEGHEPQPGPSAAGPGAPTTHSAWPVPCVSLAVAGWAPVMRVMDPAS